MNLVYLINIFILVELIPIWKWMVEDLELTL